MARHQPIDATTPSGLIAMHPDPSSWEGHPLMLCPIRDTTQQPAIQPIPLSRRATQGRPAPFSLFPLPGYAHPPAVGLARSHCRQHLPIGSPSATPAYFPDAFAVPCRAIGPLEYSTLRSASKATRAPFLTLIARPSCSCSTFPQLSPAQPSLHTAPLRPFLRDSTTELRRRTSTALPPPAHGSVTDSGKQARDSSARPALRQPVALCNPSPARAPFLGPRNR